MPDWLILAIGVTILAMIYSERGAIGPAWRQPARFWSRDPQEHLRSRGPAQPLNLVLGVVLGVGAVVYGVVALVT